MNSRIARQGRRPGELARDATGAAGECFFLDGRGGAPDGWRRPGLLAVEPRCSLRLHRRDAASTSRALGAIERRLAERRGGSADTGLAVLLSYELLRPLEREDAFVPALAVLEVDRSIRVIEDGEPVLTGFADEAEAERWRGLAARPPRDPGAAAPASRFRTSLPRERYLRAVERVRAGIARGDYYQANLCQRIDAAWRGDPLDAYERLAAASPAPRSAFFSLGDFAIASVSPETFLTSDGATIETLPIKGTRPRRADPDEDARAAHELTASGKDRAELLMIVDLERNDLGRVCETGSIEVPELAVLRSYPQVHHLVARVRGRLRAGVGFTDLVSAVFPGGSITGAPKLAAIEALRGLEPVARGPFTGSLFWCGDDGSIDSSILIRTAAFGAGEVRIGAGGGIVADSDPAGEWEESNHKARVLTRVFGFEPEEAR